ncbi:hypothetical protein PV04_04223 [Phialophora macrospora]|uniref:Uncharacterized protein n=1 Tax=Phialophora macrospora TaxID=1851006 RepID=A0A0D2CSV3_9EURO|nr:hypothetical protein PV04_04223 [Phialophora macrospora]
MWSIGIIITVAVVAAAALTFTGILLAIALERRRHNKILKAHGVTGGLSNCHRPRLSANELNYSHVVPPRALLRRSLQLPYGVVSISHDGKPENDEEKQMDAANGPADEYTEVLRPKANRSIQREFNGQPLHIPKTRRARKSPKSVPIERVPRSPLSAITEFSDPPTSAPPDTPDFPTQSTAMLLPEGAVIRPEKHVSTQWPLGGATTRCSRNLPTEIVEITARESVLMRRGGGAHNLASTTQEAFYSGNAIGKTSVAPDDPLPPLPEIDAHKRSKSHDLRRASTASLETVGSSVLGTCVSSPARNGAELNHSHLAAKRRSPAFDLALKREFATPELQPPPVKRTIHGLVTGASIRSLHPTVVMDEQASPARNHLNRPRLPIIPVREGSLKTIDASNWTPLPLKVDKLRAQAGQANRHSMIEPSKLAQWRAVSDPARGLVAEDDVFAIGDALKRPNSVAAGKPLEWNSQTGSLSKRHSSTSMTYSDGPKRGHKRQNCIRISNLPVLDKKPSLRRLPEARRPPPSNPRGSAPEGILSSTFEIKQPRPILRPRSSAAMDLKSSPTPSPFKNAPILTPTPRPARKQYIQPPASTASGLGRTPGTPRPDSEVFNSNNLDIPMSSPYNITPRHWPLSHPMQLGVINTPPSARASESSPSESPMLPPPIAWNSSLLYPRKSLVKGPRSPRNSGQTTVSSTSPLRNKQGHSRRVTKETEPSDQGELALGMPVLMLSSMDSEARRVEQESSNASEDKSPKISAVPSPPLSKRIMGLRTSTCAPSVPSSPPSPTPPQERHQALLSHGPSPLAYRNSLHRVGSTRSTKASVCLPRSRLSVSPSTRITSMISISGASIWEDASVGADSSDTEEPETVAPLALRTLAKADQNQRSLSPSRSPSRAGRNSLPTIDRRNCADPAEMEIEDYKADENENINVNANRNVYADMNASHVVQQLERVVSNGQWDRKHIREQSRMTTYNQPGDPRKTVNALTPLARRKTDLFGGTKKESGVGLGLTLKLDDLTAGTNRSTR